MPVLLVLVWVSDGRAADPLPYGQGVLWRVEAPGARASYILGTIHITDPRVHDLPDPVEAVLAAVDSLTVEVVMTPEAILRMAGAMIIQEGPGLDRILEPADFARFAAIAAGYGLPAGVLPRLAPWGAAVAIALPPGEYARIAAGEPVLDTVLQTRAASRGIPVHALETVDEQIAALSGMPQHHQLTMLQQMIAVHESIDLMFEAMVDLYLAGDIAAVHAWLVDQSAGANQDLAADFLERLVYRRNERMVARMAPRLAEGNALIAIGALHLPGDRGVLGLLVRQGYAVKRVY